MSDYISRQAAIDALNGQIKIKKMKDALAIKEYLETVGERIKRLPSAQPEAIYCKDCKYNCFNAEAGIAKCCIFHAKTNLYGFCYLGERRTDATD